VSYSARGALLKQNRDEGMRAMDKYEMEQLGAVEGERIQESLGKIWAIVGGCILIILFGGVLAWAWWTEFPLYETEEVRAITPEDQWRARKARTIDGKEVLEIPGAPGHPVAVKTRHVLGFPYGALGIVIVVAGSAAVAVGVGRLIHSLIQRPTLIIGQTCLQLVVRDQFVKVHIPYTNIREIGLIKSEGTNKPTSIGVNLNDLNDPAMHYQNAARAKKWTGWDYAIGDKELFAVPIAQIYRQLQQAMKVAGVSQDAKARDQT
jgi:hypothetical protein